MELDEKVLPSEQLGAPSRTTAIRPVERALHDTNVTLEEYMYYAERSRAEEDAGADAVPGLTLMDVLFPSRGKARQLDSSSSDEKIGVHSTGLKHTDVNLSNAAERAQISDVEWTNASRALRSASAAACFYLITTDILGPFGVGFSIGTMGWGEGIGLFTIFGICAGL